MAMLEHRVDCHTGAQAQHSHYLVPNSETYKGIQVQCVRFSDSSKNRQFYFYVKPLSFKCWFNITQISTSAGSMYLLGYQPTAENDYFFKQELNSVILQGKNITYGRQAVSLAPCFVSQCVISIFVIKQDTFPCTPCEQ